MASLAFIALSEREVYLCGKHSSGCSLHSGLSADLLGLIFLGAAIYGSISLIKNSRYWPLYYIIPAAYVICSIIYLAVKIF